MRRFLWVVGLLVVCAVVLAGAGVYWLFYTEAGLAWIVAQVPRYAGNALTITGVEGTLARGMRIDELTYRNGDTAVDAKAIELEISPSSLLLVAPRVSRLHCAEITVTSRASTSPEPRKPPASLALPLRLYVDDARVDRITVQQDGTPLQISGLALSYAGGALSHDVRHLQATVEDVTLTANGTLGTARPFAIAASVSARAHGEIPGTVSAKLRGNLLELEVAATAESHGAHGELNGVVLPFEEQQFLKALSAKFDTLDLRAFVSALPETNLSGVLQLHGGAHELAGPVELTNARPGPWDEHHLPLARLRSDIRTDFSTLEMKRIAADLGAAGALTGTGELRHNEAHMMLDTRKLNLRGIYHTLRETHLAGRVELSMVGELQKASGELAQDKLRLAFSGQRLRELVELQRFRLTARGGEVHGHARLSLHGAQPYLVNAQFAGFDPAAWGDFPKASLKGIVTLDGSLKDKSVNARYTLNDSRLLDMALSGRGDVSYGGNRIAARRMQLRLGGNDFSASGAFGRPRDVLTVHFNASRLGALDRRIAGSAQGTAAVSGTWQAPRVAFDAIGKGLAYEQEWRVGALNAKGEYQRARNAALRASITAQGIVTPGWRIAHATIDARGSESAHTIALAANDTDVALALHARGGWQHGKGWSGTILDFANRGSMPFALDSPVSLDAGSNHVHVGPFSAEIVGGSLHVGGIRYDAGRIVSDGKYRALPVRPFMALAGVPTRPNDTLRLSGAWSLTYSPQLNGYFDLHRDSGDLSVGADHPFALGLEALTCDAKITNSRVDYQALVRSRLAAGDIKGTISPSASGREFSLDAPSRFTAKADLARLATLSGLMGANVQLDGRVHAAVSGSGTLRKPVLNGTVDAERLMVALPPQGLDLRNGTLHAQLTGNEVNVREFSIHGGAGTFSAQGTLAAAGERASLDWRADRLTMLARPDRRLIVSGAGNAALEGGNVSLTGQLRAEQGTFEFDMNALPKLGPDVVVVGRRTPPPAEPTRLTHAIVDLALDLGNNLHIVGDGLDAWIHGRVRVRSDPKGELLAEGNVYTERGTYTAFGQRLQIDRGRLIFDGPVENPGLDIVAMRKNQAVQAGVAVTGSVHSPYVQIVSDPAVPESDALAWLVLGHAPSDASRGDLAMLPMAAASLFGSGKSPSGSIAQKLGVDTIGLQSASGGGTGLSNQVLAVGKRISNKLYVIYEQGLSAASNALKLEYSLTQRVVMRAEAGQTSALGLFFRYAFD